MDEHRKLADTWNARTGWRAISLDDVDHRYVAGVIDPARDSRGLWRTELESVEFRMFHTRGFVRDLAEHRGIYDPVLKNTLFAAIGWEPTGAVLSVCRLMFSDPAVPLPVLTAVNAGCMQINDIPALIAARTVRHAAVEATIVSVPANERPVGAVSPTNLCHGLFMAVAATRGCDWILSAVDPGALSEAHVHAAAGHLIETVGSGQDTAGIASSVVALGVDEVIGWLAHDPTGPVSAAMTAGRRLLAMNDGEPFPRAA